MGCAAPTLPTLRCRLAHPASPLPPPSSAPLGAGRRAAHLTQGPRRAPQGPLQLQVCHRERLVEPAAGWRLARSAPRQLWWSLRLGSWVQLTGCTKLRRGSLFSVQLNGRALWWVLVSPAWLTCLNVHVPLVPFCRGQPVDEAGAHDSCQHGRGAARLARARAGVAGAAAARRGSVMASASRLSTQPIPIPLYKYSPAPPAWAATNARHCTALHCECVLRPQAGSDIC